eukprot:349694-Chlamydomonas_euryale.AAC.2
MPSIIQKKRNNQPFPLPSCANGHTRVGQGLCVWRLCAHPYKLRRFPSCFVTMDQTCESRLNVWVAVLTVSPHPTLTGAKPDRSLEAADSPT